MRIAYLFHYNRGTSDGVRKKIEEQARCWELEGHRANLFQITKDDTDRQYWSVPSSVFKYQSKSRFAIWVEAAESIVRGEYDVIYHRFDMFYPGLRRLMRHKRTILEINTNDRKEYFQTGVYRGLYNLLTRRLLLDAAAGAVFVSRELRRISGFDIVSKPSTVIGNGASLAEIKLAPPPGNNRPKFVFLGTDNQSWHGIDKILELGRVRPLWDFYVIGMEAPVDSSLCVPNVAFCGRLQRSDYARLLASADFAIGTLALHRKNMAEASPLKVREYLSMGLPTIIGYEDTDFAPSCPFLLNLGNFERNVSDNLSRIDSFVEEWAGRRVPRSEIAHLDVKVKERARLKFLGEVINMQHV